MKLSLILIFQYHDQVYLTFKSHFGQLKHNHTFRYAYKSEIDCPPNCANCPLVYFHLFTFALTDNKFDKFVNLKSHY